MADNGHLVRYVAPTKFDTAEYGMVWHQMLDDGKKIYIQVNKDENSPNWIEIGKFLQKVFSHKLDDDEFVFDCLQSYNSP